MKLSSALSVLAVAVASVHATIKVTIDDLPSTLTVGQTYEVCYFNQAKAVSSSRFGNSSLCARDCRLITAAYTGSQARPREEGQAGNRHSLDNSEAHLCT